MYSKRRLLEMQKRRTDKQAKTTKKSADIQHVEHVNDKAALKFILGKNYDAMDLKVLPLQASVKKKKRKKKKRKSKRSKSTSLHSV